MFEQLPLKDIHLPDPVSWWPPALGWWLLVIAALVLLWITWKSIKIVVRYVQKQKLRRFALKQLQIIQDRYQTERDAGVALRSLSELIRRIAITFFDDPGIPGKVGADWVAWLSKWVKEDHDRQLFSLLEDTPYRPSIDIDPEPLFKASRHWIEYVVHRRVEMA